MQSKKKDKTSHWLIGCYAEVIEAENVSLLKIKGKIIDETMNMIEFEGGRKVLKKEVVLRVKDDYGEHIIDGKSLSGRSEDRFKNKESAG